MMTQSNYIGGVWVPGSGDSTFDNRNPADHARVLHRFPDSTSADADSAVRAALAAQVGWSERTAPQRADFLMRASRILEDRTEEIARGLSDEEGKTLPEARGETSRAVSLLRYYAGACWLAEGEVIPSSTPGALLYTRRLPLGVCALITPWNFPIAIPVWKAAPALAFGNCVVLKPSEHASGTALRLAQVFHDAGLPAGVFNVLFGTHTAGEALVAHAEVKGISFTGSAATGKKVALAAVERGARYQLEMGGKNGLLVMADADLSRAAALTLSGAFRSAGEKCTATSRCIVHEGIYDEFCAVLLRGVGELRTGPAEDEDCVMGPLISQEALERVEAFVGRALHDGAELLCGGSRLTGDPFDRGWYFAPTILSGVRPEMEIAQDEVFGPVLCLMRCTDDSAMTLLNGTKFGLSASIVTQSLKRAMEFAASADVGMVKINGETAGVELQAPFGGVKGSSSFSREQGSAAREFYTQLQTVSVEA
ncbi:MAG: aldehyde dehydrogenase family protein [Armatimonadetes bacterium]|nr:aldehyde dehydrogenase family protein [Armatimonadota bacterium]MDE2206928.1 aldehyde dehydrogenase family protein [Armatimonadota bacterium]